jgi:hypothetical protein
VACPEAALIYQHATRVRDHKIADGLMSRDLRDFTLEALPNG